MITDNIEINKYNAIETIANEIKDRIDLLRTMGVSYNSINQLISLSLPAPKLSKMVITEDFRIILKDYDEMEIKMPTLSKVVYFLYLNHPEGIMFKHLANYRDELLKIYITISPRENIEKMKQSIDDITSSRSNSINEKCSRIKTGFTKHLADNLACQYYITGNSGTPKKILLDRKLVVNKSAIKIKK